MSADGDDSNFCTQLRARLGAALSAIEIRGPGACLVAGRPLPIASGAVPGADAGPEPLIASLRDYLYGHVYCRTVPQSDVARDPNPMAQGDLVPALAAATPGRDRLEGGWQAVSVDAHGTLLATRHGLRRTALRADYEFARGGTPAIPRPGELVALWLRAARNDPGVPFYFVFGARPDTSPDGQAMLRLYWHLTPTLAPEFVHRLATLFDRHGLPFMFKCLDRRVHYPRVDSGTLFLRRPWYRAALPSIAELQGAVASALGAEVPLFTRPLARGLGFAESPAEGASFGLDRAGLLARALWHAFLDGRHEGAARLASVERFFHRCGISFERPYLNPWSLDRYGGLP